MILRLKNVVGLVGLKLTFKLEDAKAVYYRNCAVLRDIFADVVFTKGMSTKGKK